MDISNLPELVRTTVVLGLIFTLLSLFSIVLRLLSRKAVKAKYSTDDWWIIIAFVILLASEGVILWGNMPRSSPTFGPADEINYYKSLMIDSCIYPLITVSIKMSILCLYRRIFTTQNFRRVSSFVGLVVVAWFIAIELGSILTCIPVAKFWDPILPGRCINFNLFFLVNSIMETVLDFVILLLPIPMILGLQLSKQNKAILSGIFLLGGFVVITGILRLTFSYTPGGFHVNFDQVDLWSLLHVCTGIICACLPTYRPLLAKMTALPSTLRKKYNMWSTSQRLVDSTQSNSKQLPSVKSGSGYHYNTNDSHRDLIPLTIIEAANKSQYVMDNGYDTKGITVRSTVDIV